MEEHGPMERTPLEKHGSIKSIWARKEMEKRIAPELEEENKEKLKEYEDNKTDK